MAPHKNMGPSAENPTRVSEVDPRLLPFLSANTERDADAFLAELLDQEADPVVRRIARAKLRPSEGDAADDVCAEVRLQILSRLQELRAKGDPSGIADFKAYVAVAAYNACHDHLRARYPQRARLKSRLRYVLTHQAGFAAWKGPGGETLCGYAAWKDSGPRAAAPAVDQLRHDLFAVAGSPARGLADQIAGLFDRLGGSVEVDDLVDAVARVLGIEDAPVLVAAELDDLAAPPVADALAGLDERAALARLWTEIVALPPRQRTALLLNLRDGADRDVIALLPQTGTASLTEIAAAVGLEVERLAQLWGDLPLEDAVVAALLGVTRQQVINLRKCARERLARRLRPGIGRPQ